jgi:hypothetical protein
MRWMIVAYIGVVLLGLILIESRTGWTICRDPGSKFPTITAAVYFFFFPDRLRYIASGDLKEGHQLQETDLAINPTLPSYLIPYLAAKTSLVGKYLPHDLHAGEPIRDRDVRSSLSLAPEERSYIVHIRLKQPPPSTQLLEPRTPVTLSFPASNEKLEGTMEGETTLQATPGTTGKPGKTQK